MTHTAQREDAAVENGVPHPGDTSDPPITHNSSLHPAMDSASDNDTSERPVREKLKKTSIASIPKSGPNPSRHEIMIGSDPKIAAQKPDEGTSSGQEAVKALAETRGRPLRKRSFDDLEAEEGSACDQSIANQSGHLRKRSRDIRVGEDIKGDERPRGSGQVPVQEEEEDEADMVDKDLSGPRQDNVEHTAKDLSPSSHQDVTDQEMRDSAFSPRKKRSRDQLDTETHREQKIPATEEAKAHRRSEENEREVILQNGNIADHANVQSMQDDQPKSVGEDSEGLNEPSTIAGKDATLSSSFNAIGTAMPLSAPQSTLKSEDSTSQQTQTSADAFASSGFAALSGSSTSPFGTLGVKSITTGASPFASVAASDVKGPRGSDLSNQDKKEAVNGIFGSTAKSTSSGFSTLGSSGFGTAGTSNVRTFGGSSLGSGFGSGFGGAPKLTSFAAAAGDARWGSGSSEIKPFGAPDQDVEDEEAGGSEIGAESIIPEENNEADGRFQQQGVETGEDGEETVFSTPRAALFRFDGTSWKEGGRGMFKFNVNAQMPDAATVAQKSGRFIMRAHQTYRVLLNEPIFKEMLVGDAKGNEPKSKSFAFAVIEKGRAVPHMIRISDEAESKTLYHEVRKLQRRM